MNKFKFTVEFEAFEGVKRIAQKVALDFEKVSGIMPDITETFPIDVDSENIVVFATLGKSPIVEKLISEGKFDPSAINGKREVYRIMFIGKMLLICGSDKRGTIYGMFALSEHIGVSPLCFWGDVEPVCREKIEITKEIETISKEPSVKWRGFFINDEWPCFGNWTFERYGGFTAEMYDNVFEFLLRMKGNYLWPAMWTSSFPLDGPDHLNEELADIYGIVMGASHHEPCLRASEEWDLVRGAESAYGNDWDYYKNKKGLLKYWEDGLKRSGKYEKIITIGMRGERDSSMLGDASLKDNINILKDIITNQRILIQNNVNADIDTVPQVLALYKEVEEYFYGNENVEGLKDWDEIKNVIFMLCEDNFGFMRTLPSEEMRSNSGHKGGFGMYYHFDYHGSPISFEWMPSTPFEKTREQMSTTYDYGVRDIWIVNVGDLKFNEVPLMFFMDLAYDFEKWGTGAVNSDAGNSISENCIGRYTSSLLEKTFPSVDTATREKLAEVLHGFTKMNALRRPEALNPDIFHPCHYLEADRMLAMAERIDTLNEEVYTALLKGNTLAADAYYSMIYYSAKISVNLFRMHLYAGKNRHYANQGKKIANDFAALVTDCIEKDRSLSEEFVLFKNGKWKGMELAQHIGFVKWNEDNCRYPLRFQVEPAYKPRMVVSRKDSENVYTKAYGEPETLKINDFLSVGNDEIIIEIANDGIGSFDYVIEPQAQYDWLEISALKGTVESQNEIIIRCNKQKLNDSIKTAKLLVKDSETVVVIEISAKAQNVNLPPMTFLANNGVVTINSNHFCDKKDAALGNTPCGFVELVNYGRTGCGMKVYPTTANFDEVGKDGKASEKPALSYRFLIEETGEYVAEVWTTPTNPVRNKTPLRFVIEKADVPNDAQVITAVPADFNAGNSADTRWSQGVLDNIRVSKALFTFEKGVNDIWISALEAGLIIERILIYQKKNAPRKSYLGPLESFFVRN
ncbi:MAG: glycosyl hydrolase 115 family protein [Treponema sp.]|nr:glycosyl hydrolase 115 family protein [Treponema sp.]